ncbi:SDR family NAD(P)-dependent oxidoreductase [Streptomyces xanthophaeus]|uniref:SDR family NAD(P)-dependent oxidoreductase n=1 Tax=Streptomyces xanthophaeus TaxID=67385 RepID=UPI0012FF1530|nr:SDR family NAD(P)-dependent oxidoreductase [Streptomyces xanthophaeus]
MLAVGATAVLGGLAAPELCARSALVALAGRDPGLLTQRAARLGARPARRMDAYDTDGCAALAPWAHEQLGGLDGVLVTVGVAGFGLVQELPDTAAEHLFQVNVLCPAPVLRSAVGLVAVDGFLAAVTGAIVDTPMRATADYAASKTALSCWLGVLGREVRHSGLRVFDFRPPHLDTGFADRPVRGHPPTLPPGADPLPAVSGMVDQLAGTGARHGAFPHRTAGPASGAVGGR